MELEKARAIAEELKGLLAPACEKITIAGSIRRQKPEVGDIELLIIPKFDGLIDLLDRELKWLIGTRVLGYRPTVNRSIIYGPKNKLLRHMDSGIGLDVFSVTGLNWGMALFVRTGPAEWNIKAMSRFRELGMYGHAYGGISDSDGKEILCPDEETVFRYLQWEYTPPEERA